MKSYKFDEQTRDKSASHWLPVSSAVCRLGKARYPEKYMKFDYSGKKFHEGYYGI